MQRHYSFLGVEVEKLLLFFTVLSSLLLMTSAKFNSNNFVLDKLKYQIASYENIASRPLEINGFKDDAIDMFDTVMDFFSPLTNEITGSRQYSGSMDVVEHFTIRNIIADGRCMFRALVMGMAANDGVSLNSNEQTIRADELKMEIKRSICDSDNEHQEFEDALVAITVDETLERYCNRIMRDRFWGGEAELLILSKLLSLPVTVYVPVQQNILRVRGSAGFIPVSRYRPEFKNGTTRAEPKKDVRLLFNHRLGMNHYDLLL